MPTRFFFFDHIKPKYSGAQTQYLEAMSDNTPPLELVAGDNDETRVIAEIYRDGHTVIFWFELDASLPKSRPSRIFACYHQLEGKPEDETYPWDRKSMREAIRGLIQAVWDVCGTHPAITLPDAAVQINEDANGKAHWRIRHESLYNDYVGSLRPAGSLAGSDAAEALVDNASLVRMDRLGGRGTATLVHESGNLESSYVFKGIEYIDFLTLSESFAPRRDMFYHEVRALQSLPEHPNILPAPEKFVTVRKIGGRDDCEFICGMLLPFLGDGRTLDDEVKESNIFGTPLALQKKALWCCEMTAAVAHTHLVAHTFHMDIKPTNLVVNNSHSLVLVDWEQHRAPKCTIAPEADGTWDVKEGRFDPSSSNGPALPLSYQKHTGSLEEQNPWNWPTRNVFPIWNKTNPRAVEAAEVFSLGRTMWLLLEQYEQDDWDFANATNRPILWDHEPDKTPQSWKDIVNRCTDVDPNKRPRLQQLVEFWKAEQLKELEELTQEPSSEMGLREELEEGS